MFVKNPPELLYLAALKQVPVDILVKDCVVFNSITGEFLEKQAVWIKDGWIAYCGADFEPLMDEHTKIIDAKGRTILPSLIEAHTHVMSLTGIEEYVRFVIPSGTTTVVTETIELASVVGADGIDFFIRGLKYQPVRFFYTLAPLSALTSELEAYAPQPEIYREYLKDPYCLGIGEVYWPNALIDGEQGNRVRTLCRLGLAAGKLIEGHTAGARGIKLQAYTDLGISSCHEPITEEEVLERLRLGYWVMIRQGAIRKELDAVASIFTRNIDHRRVIICTDSMDPESFINEGSLDAAVRRAIKLGVPLEKVYQAVTINVAEHFGLSHVLGFLGPGRIADLVFIPSPGEYKPEIVMREGKVIYENNQLIEQPRKVEFPDWMFDTVRPDRIPDLSMPESGRRRGIELVTRLVTKEVLIDFSDVSGSKDVIMALAVERTGRGGAFLGFIENFGLKRGACGSTMCWDTTDMIVLGCDPESISTVIKRLKAMGGGTVYAINDKVIAEYRAQLCGVVGLYTMEEARERIKAFEDALRENGVPWDKPMLTLVTLGTAAIPHLRISHEGYVRLRDHALLDIFVEE